MRGCSLMAPADDIEKVLGSRLSAKKKAKMLAEALTLIRKGRPGRITSGSLARRLGPRIAGPLANEMKTRYVEKRAIHESQ